MDRKIEKKKWTPKKVTAISVTGVIIFIIIYSLLFDDGSSKLNVERKKVTVSTVQKGPFQEYIPVTGAIIPIKTIYLDAVEGGRVEEIFIEAGSNVQKGDKILRLGNTNLLLDIMFREAELSEQSNNLRNTRLDMEKNRLALRTQLVELDYQIKQLKRAYERNAKLLKKNLISEEEFAQSRDEYQYYKKRKKLAIESFKQDSIFRKVQIEQLEKSLQSMRENLELVRQKLDNLVIEAPITGQLTSLNAEIGELKSAGERLGQVDVLDAFKVRASIDEHYLARIHLGLNGEFDFAGETHRLITQKIYPEIRDGRFDVDMAFVQEEPSGIRRGQTVHIRLELGDPAEAVLLARGGFYQKTGGQWVYVVDEDGNSAVKRRIRLGRQNPQMFEVLEGLQPGEKVITSSYDNFGDIDKLILKQ
ncbi:MAG: HlyD family efflux transporter periplasmic adaptor subunit [Caldithrix sp.]|nr:HlyD family efflux transporter periplasmic adaptor subunit [Caldithrix sp.]